MRSGPSCGGQPEGIPVQCCGERVTKYGIRLSRKINMFRDPGADIAESAEQRRRTEEPPTLKVQSAGGGVVGLVDPK